MSVFCVLRVAAMAAVAGMTGLLAECEGGGTLRVEMPGLIVEVDPGAPKQALPPGYTPTTTKTVRVRDKRGRWFTLSICIAESPSDPDCVFVKLGGCDPSDGWIKACQDSDASSSLTPDGVLLPPSDVSVYLPCPDENMSFSYDAVSGTITLDFVTTACGDSNQALPDDLIDVYFVSPGSSSVLSYESFDAIHGGVIPPGTQILMSGDAQTVAWNALLLNRTYGELVADSGDEITLKIVRVGYGMPPLAVVIVDEQLVWSEFIVYPH